MAIDQGKPAFEKGYHDAYHQRPIRSQTTPEDHEKYHQGYKQGTMVREQTGGVANHMSVPREEVTDVV